MNDPATLIDCPNCDGQFYPDDPTCQFCGFRDEAYYKKIAEFDEELRAEARLEQDEFDPDAAEKERRADLVCDAGEYEPEEFEFDNGSLCSHGWTNPNIDCPKCDYEAELKAEFDREQESKVEHGGRNVLTGGKLD